LAAQRREIKRLREEIGRMQGVLKRLAPKMESHHDGLISYGCTCRWIGDEQVAVCEKHQ
jgi:hypothetical protein